MAESSSDDAVSLSQVISVVRRHLVAIVLITIAAVAAALTLGGAALGGTYSARAVVTLTPLPDNPISTAQPRAVSTTTESSVVTSTSVAELAGQSLGWRASTRELLSHVSVASPLDSQVLQISFEGGTPDEAADGANAFATSYLAYRKQVAQNQIDSVVTRLQDQISTLTKQQDAAQTKVTAAGDDAARAKAETTARQLGALVQSLREQVSAARSSPTDAGQLAGRALAPTASAGPGSAALGAGGLVIGLLVGALLALVVESRDHRVRDASRLETASGVPTLSVLRLGSAPAAAAEEMRRLGATLTDLRLSDQHRVVVLAAGRVSAEDAAANLAWTLADSGRSTALLALGESVARVVHALELPPANLRDGHAAAGQSAAASGLLDVVSLGPERRLPLEIATPGEALGRLLRDTTTLVVDAVNVERPSSAMLLARLGGRCVGLADSQNTTLDDIARLRRDLRLVDAELVGMVLVVGPRRSRSRKTKSKALPGVVESQEDFGRSAPDGTAQRRVSVPNGIDTAPALDGQRTENGPETENSPRSKESRESGPQAVERAGGRR